jgi:hypothetical protein
MRSVAGRSFLLVLPVPDCIDRASVSTDTPMHPRLHARHLLLLAAALLTLAHPAMAGALRVTLERAGIQTSPLDPLLLTTETFDGHTPGSATRIDTAVGTLSSVDGGQAIAPNTSTGGADQPIGPGAQATLDLSAAAGGPGPVDYFGFWWSAADSGNSLVVNMVDGDEALFGSQILQTADADSRARLGNPTAEFAGQNPSEPYAYVNLYAQDPDSRIASVVFRQAAGTDAFELDNLSIAAGLITAAPVGPADAPAPGTLLLLAPALALLARRPRVRRLQSAPARARGSIDVVDSCSAERAGC